MALMGASSSISHMISKFQTHLRLFSSAPSLKIRSISGKSSLLMELNGGDELDSRASSSSMKQIGPPFSGLENTMMGYIFGKKKATEVAHAVWKKIVRKGDVVVDATCGNGYDTLALVRLVADDTQTGRVYAIDLQKHALENTSSLLHQSLTADERELVELYSTCHSKLEEIVPSDANVRLVAFNLGYLPGGDKHIKTETETTLLALEASKRVVIPGGLISVVAYLGHSGGREEFEKVERSAGELEADQWICTKLQLLNRPFAPVLLLLYKKEVKL